MGNHQFAFTKAITKLESLVSDEEKEHALAKSRVQQVQSFSLQNLTGVFAQLNTAFQDDKTPPAEQIERFLLGLYMRRDFVWQKELHLNNNKSTKIGNLSPYVKVLVA